MIIHPLISIIIALIVQIKGKNQNFLLYLIIGISLGVVIATRGIEYINSPDDLITYTYFSRIMPQMSIVELIEFSRYEPIFYLHYWLNGGYEKNQLLLINSIISSVAFTIGIFVLGNKYNIEKRSLLLTIVALYPYEAISNIPRQMFAVGVYYILVNSRYKLLSIFAHKATIINNLIFRHYTKSDAVILAIVALISYIYLFEFVNEFFIKRTNIYLTNVSSWRISSVLILSTIISMIAVAKKNIEYSNRVLLICIILIFLSGFGEFANRLIFLIYPIIIIYIIEINSRLFTKSLYVKYIYNITFLILFFVRITSGGDHEPFSGKKFEDIFIWLIRF